MERIKDVYLEKFKGWSLCERVIVDKLDEIVDKINILEERIDNLDNWLGEREKARSGKERE